MNRRLMMLLVTAQLLLAGCATNMTAENKASIRKVAIARQIEMPDRPIVAGSSAGAAFLLGGVAGLALNQSTSDLPSQFVLALSAQQISVQDLMRQALEQQLKDKGFDVVFDEAQADAVLKVAIRGYGLTGNILSSEDKRFPLLSTRFEMVRRNSDQVVWKKHVATNTIQEIMDKQEWRPLADYFKDGPLMKREHEKVAKLVASYAFRDF